MASTTALGSTGSAVTFNTGETQHDSFSIDVLPRLPALIAGRDSIRDVIAFPKTASGGDPLTGAPAPVDARQLRELGLRSIVEQG